MDRATFSFKNPTKKVKGVITVDVNKTDFAYPVLQELHKQVINYVRDPYTKDGINGFIRSRQGRSADQGIERYTKQVDQNELEQFKDTIYDMPASSSFIEAGNKDVVKDYVDSLINEMGYMTMGGRRRTKRRNKRSAKKSKRKSRRYSKKH
jgi:hypothetical protein